MFTPLFPNMSLSLFLIDLHPLHGPATAKNASLVFLIVHLNVIMAHPFNSIPSCVSYHPPPSENSSFVAGGCANLCVMGLTHPRSPNLLPSKMRHTNPPRFLSFSWVKCVLSSQATVNLHVLRPAPLEF